jgi:hypothetical protein
VTVSVIRWFLVSMGSPWWDEKPSSMMGLCTLARIKFHLNDLLRLRWSSRFCSP